MTPLVKAAAGAIILYCATRIVYLLYRERKPPVDACLSEGELNALRKRGRL